MEGDQFYVFQLISWKQGQIEFFGVGFTGLASKKEK